MSPKNLSLSTIKLCELIFLFSSKKLVVFIYNKQLSGKKVSALKVDFLLFFK
jgi:hypothetical protein